MNCNCNCSPCNCSSPGGEGCLPDLCAPRACFFNGQLISSDDLNVATNYARTKDLLFGRFVAGWGIYGGLQVSGAPGLAFSPLGVPPPPQITPIPQVIAGTTVQVSAGVAIDARGRTLTLCAPATLDLVALANESPVAPMTKTCEEWFDHGGAVAGCNPNAQPITAREYYLVAEYIETPARPAPQFSGGGACDPAPTCEFSRKIEGVKFSLVPAPVSDSYQVSGCLDGVVPSSLGNLDPYTADPERGMPAFVDAANQALAEMCCDRAVVILARVLLTSSTGGLGNPLPQVPLYAFLDSRGRRSVPSSALNWLFTLSLASRDTGAPVAVGQVIDAIGTKPKYSSRRGFSSNITRTGPVGEFSLDLESSLPPGQRVVNVTATSDPQQPSPVFANVGTLTTDNAVQVVFYDITGALANPFAFHVTVHAAPADK